MASFCFFQKPPMIDDPPDQEEIQSINQSINQGINRSSRFQSRVFCVMNATTRNEAISERDGQ
jgi:hypothetical protein